MRGWVAFFTYRPVLSGMLGGIVLLLGLQSLVRLPLDLLPDVELPVISVRTDYPNAGPEEVEEFITRPLEQVISGLPGLEDLDSTSSEGHSRINVRLSWGADLNEASSDLRDRLERVVNNLPDEADRPVLRKFDPNQRAIVVAGVTSRMDPLLLRDLLDKQIVPSIEQIPGIALVDVRGALEREVRVELDADRLQAFNLAPSDIVTAIRRANVIQPAGELREGSRDLLLRTPALLDGVESLENTLVDWRDGAAIRVGDVGRVVDGHRELTRIVRVDGEPGTRLLVRKQSGANTVEAAQQTLAALERLERDFPQLEFQVIEDRSTFIQASLRNVGIAMGAGSFLAVCVLIFFLRSARSTIAVAVAIPFSLIGTFVLIYFQGMTLNLFTLGGLALGIGLMVDNAIVVIENIYRYRGQGLGLRESAIRGTVEVGAPIITSTLTTVAIFLPIFFMEGTVGVLFRQLALVVAFALFCSLMVSLTVVPMLAGNLPEKAGRGRDAPVWARAAERIQNKLADRYHQLLLAAVSRKWVVFAVVVLLTAGSAWLFPRLGQEFFPQADESQVTVRIDVDPELQLESLDEIVAAIEPMIPELVPELRNMELDMGRRAWIPGLSGRIRINLVSVSQRSRSSGEIAAALQRELDIFPGVRLRVAASGEAFNVRRLGVGGEDGERLAMEISGFDLAALDAVAAQVTQRIEDIPGVVGTRVSRETGAPRLAARIDRERAADLGFHPERIARDLQTLVGGSRAGRLRGQDGSEVDIWVRLQEARSLGREDLLNLAFISGDGRAVALQNFVSFESERGATQILRRNQQRVNTVSIDIGGRPSGDVAEDIREEIFNIPLPDNIQVAIRGDYEEQQRAFRALLISLILALVLVYMVMACLYESLRDPLIVMLSVPLAASGGLLALWLTNTTLNVQSYIGFIMLIGIVVNNAILIVNQANSIRQSGGSAQSAAVEAARIRFRPIIMTMLTTILALSPLAIGWGDGGEAQAGLARVVVGGLLSSSVITLFLIPCVYPLFHWRQTESIRE